MAGTLSTPQAGSPNSSEDPKVATAIAALNANLDGSNLLDGARLGAGTVPNAALAGSIAYSKLALTGAVLNADLAGSIADGKLASPNNSVYRTLFKADSIFGLQAGAATYLLTAHRFPATSGLPSTLSATVPVGIPPVTIEFDDADYTVAGLTQKLRLRAQVLANATAPAINFTFGLYPISAVAGGADALTYTAGSVVTGSTIAINTPSASTVTRGTPTADFTIPADGVYALGCVTSGAIASNSGVSLHAQLQTRNV